MDNYQEKLNQLQKKLADCQNMDELNEINFQISKIKAQMELNSINTNQKDISEAKKEEHTEDKFVINSPMVGKLFALNNEKIYLDNDRITLSNSKGMVDIFYSDLVDCSLTKATLFSDGIINIKSKFGDAKINYPNSHSKECESLYAFLKKIPSGINEKLVTENKNMVSIKEEKKPKTKKEIIKENKAAGIACCPRCGSTSLATGNKRLSIGRGIVGGVLLGPLGAGIGAVTSKKVVVTCLNCGHKWKL